MDLQTMQLLDPVDGVAEVRLVRQDGGPNCFTEAVANDLSEVTDRLFQMSANLQGVLVTAAGPFWMHQMPLSEARRIQGRDDQTPVAWAKRVNKVLNDFQDLEIPTVALLQGPAYGAGLELALCMNARVALDQVRMGFTERDYGFIPGLMGPWRMAALAGLHKTMLWARTGGEFTASVAAAMRVVNNVANPDEMRPIGLDLIHQLNAPGALLQHKRRTILTPPNDRPPEIAAEARFANDQIENARQGFMPWPNEVVSLLEDTVCLKRDRAVDPWAERFGLVARTTAADALMSMNPALDASHAWAHNASRKLGRINSVGLIVGPETEGHIPARLAGGSRVVLYGATASSATLTQQSATQKLQDDLKDQKIHAEAFSKALANLVVATSVQDLDTCNFNLDLRPATEAPRVLGNSLWLGDMPDHRIFETESPLAKLVGISVMPWRGAPAALLTYGPKVHPNVLYVALAMSHHMGLKPVPCTPTPAGMIHRILMAGVVTYATLMNRGIAYEVIDQNLREQGWSMGLGQMIDHLGPAAVSYRLGLLQEAIPERYRIPSMAPLEAVLSANRKLYRPIPAGHKKPPVDEETRSLVAKVRSGPDLALKKGQIASAVINSMVFEATHCVDLVAGAPIVDFGCVMSQLFPAHIGGPFVYLEATGLTSLLLWRDDLVKRCPELDHCLKASPYITERFKGATRAA